MKENILIVDDDEQIRHLLGGILDFNGFNYTLAANAAEAREKIRAQDFALVFSDINMPGESGLDFVRKAIHEYPDLAVVMVTGLDDTDVAETALELGAYGYMIKPFRRNEVINNVANALKRRKLEIQSRAYQKNLENTVEERTKALQTALSDLRKTMEGIILAIASAIEMKDPYTAGHQKRVAALAQAIAKEMNLSEEQMEGIRIASVLHDIGKIALPGEILSKPGQLNDMEFDLIKSHPQAGCSILKDIEFPRPVQTIILQHHEMMDGSGYPQGLLGKDLLIEAKVLAVADVVEAMSSHRPYRPGLGKHKALEEISRKRGLLYDQEVVDACLRVVNGQGFTFDA